MNKKQWVVAATGIGILASTWLMARLTFAASEIYHYRFRMLICSFGGLVLVGMVLFILKD